MIGSVEVVGLIVDVGMVRWKSGEQVMDVGRVRSPTYRRRKDRERGKRGRETLITYTASPLMIFRISPVLYNFQKKSNQTNGWTVRPSPNDPSIINPKTHFENMTCQISSQKPIDFRKKIREKITILCFEESQIC